MAALAAAALWAGPAQNPGDTPHASPALDTEAGLRRTLDALESRYEAACVKMGQARLGRLTGSSDAPKALDGARAALRDVYADPSLAPLLETWARRTTVTSDPTLTRRVHLWDVSRTAAACTLDPATTALEDELLPLLTAPLTVGGKPLSRAEAARVLREDPDPARRREIYEAMVALGRATRPKLLALIHSRADRILQERPRYFHHLIYQANDLDAMWIFNVMERLASRTRLPYLALVDSMKKAIGQPRLMPWDIDYAMEKLSEKRGTADLVRERFGSIAAGAKAVELLEKLGFPAADLPARITPQDPFLPLPGLAVKLPADFRIVVPPASPQALGPIEAFDDLLRQFGRGLQATHSAVSAPMLQGYPWVPGALNEPYAEGMAETIASFSRDPIFLTRIMKLDRREADLVAADMRDRALLRFRRTLLRLGMEFTIYVNPEADLDERYRVIAEKSLAVTLPPEDAAAWGADPELVSRPVYGATLMVADSIAVEAHERLREAFGDKRISDRTAGWLIEHCYAGGESLPLDYRLAKSIDGGYDFDKYLASIGIETDPD